ncbi:hypothetical protein H4Q26_004033 [Puccinia striiformis f. sp. tritici PST-130]|nr:hypothetical protein H4Q26_004033 [Puccinia striiformis f. sp. tritici PST-130]
MSSSRGIVHDIPGGGMSGSPYSEIVDPIIDLLVAYMVMIGWQYKTKTTKVLTIGKIQGPAGATQQERGSGKNSPFK